MSFIITILIRKLAPRFRVLGHKRGASTLDPRPPDPRRAEAGPGRAAEQPSPPREDRRGGPRAQVAAPHEGAGSAARSRPQRPAAHTPLHLPQSPHRCWQSRRSAVAPASPRVPAQPARHPLVAHPAAALHARSAPSAPLGTGDPATFMLPAVYTALAGLLLLPLLVNFCCPYFFQDMGYFLRVAGLARRVRSYARRRPVRTVLQVFLEKVRKTPHKPLLLFQDETLTYAQVDRRSNQVARALRDHLGLRQGDCVALFMGNEPAYVWLWLGLAKLGCAMACLNSNIRAKSLLHCFQCCGAKVLLVSPGEPGDRPPPSPLRSPLPPHWSPPLFTEPATGGWRGKFGLERVCSRRGWNPFSNR